MPTMDQLSPLEQQVAREFARRVRQAYGTRVLDLRVFGSRARRQARPDSDLDVLVLLDHAPEPDREAITDLATDIMLEGPPTLAVSPRIMSGQDYQRLIDGERLFPREVDRDGIPL